MPSPQSRPLTDARLAQALAHHQQGRLDRAQEIYETLMRERPQLADAWHLSGLLLHQLGQSNRALERLERAIALNAKAALYHYNLGAVRQALGALNEARACYERALALDPSHADSHDNLGVIHKIQGRLEAALRCHERALALNPAHALALYHLGLAWEGLGQYASAAACYERALAARPSLIDARRAWAGVVKYLSANEHPVDLADRLLAVLPDDEIHAQALAPVTARLLVRKHKLAVATPDAALLDRLARDELFLLFLRRVVNVDAEMERFLSRLRRTLLLAGVEAPSRVAPHARLIAALAEQCFNNEYVFELDAEERAAHARLAGAEPPSVEALLLYSLYAPLHELEAAACLAAEASPDWVQSWLARTRDQPLAQRALRDGIPVLTAIEDATSRGVQRQYEQNPYPRWLSLPRVRAAPLAAAVQQLFPQYEAPAMLREPIEVLVAGCGTGRHAINAAMAYQNARVLAIDLSRASLAYGLDMARRLGVDNIEFAQADVLALPSLGRRFQLIECMGVLHHLREPLAGWRALTQCLAPRALMRVGLYSEAARALIVQAREHIRSLALDGENPDDIRRLRRRCLAGELGNLTGLARWRDFFSLSECRDLMFHHTEHRFTLAQIAAALDQLGLRFLGFAFTDARVPRAFRAAHPDETAFADFSRWAAFERQFPDAFSDMYQFWCEKV